jgi:hypothetical protein
MVSAEVICRTAFGAATLLGFPVFFAAAYYLAGAQANVRAEMRWRASLMGPLAFFLPLYYTEIGNRYRRRFLLLMLCFFLLWSTAWSITYPCGMWN